MFLTAAGVSACDKMEQPTKPEARQEGSDFFDAGRPEVGSPLPFLTREQRRLFERGRAVFQFVFTEETGLGPLFNADGCATCHAMPAVGGVGPQIETHATLRVGDDCDEQDEINGGSVVQNEVTELARGVGVVNEEPPAGTDVGRRTTPDLFGFGLLEAVPEEEILSRADPEDRNRDGISGRPNRSEEGHLGRFGRKAALADLLDFIADAFIYEQGITNPPDEVDEQTLAQFPGVPLPDGADPADDPEVSEEDVLATTTFVRFLAPPAPLRLDWSGEQGRRLFGRIGCADCHVPALRTGRSSVRALSNKVVYAYSDLLLHDMGPALADVCSGEARPAEFRTEPLMGVRFANAFLHDGRAATLEEAILAHGGEGARARARFGRLSRGERAALLRFLKSL